jgi:hypothetical protein
MSAPAPRGGRPGAARPTPRRHRVVVCVQSPGIHACTKFVSKIQLRPRRAPRAFAAFRLATIYLPQFLLLKWVVVKYSGGPLPQVHRLSVFGLASCWLRGLALMDTDLWKRTCEIDYFRTISYGIEIPNHEIVRKILFGKVFPNLGA